MELSFDQYSPLLHNFIKSQKAKVNMYSPVGLADYSAINYSHCIGYHHVRYHKEKDIKTEMSLLVVKVSVGQSVFSAGPTIFGVSFF